MPEKSLFAGAITIAVLAALVTSTTVAAAPQRNRIPDGIRNSQRVRFRGHVPGNARAENDEGPVDPSMSMDSLTLVLKPSADQPAALDRLLAEQQDPKSANYHRLLTPEEYADRFGVSTDDLQKIAAWLGQQGLTVTGTGRARNWISFRGSAQQVQTTFGVQIHHFRVNGAAHFSNADEPSIPVALDAVVRGIHGLNDFRYQPRHVVHQSLEARYTSTRGSHYLAPDDFAAIYNLKPLYDAGIDGTAQSIVVVGQSQINLPDVQQFRTNFNLPASDPQVILVPNLRDPGVSDGDVDEAHLDIEWAGAVARNAKILYVYSFDVTDAVQYAVDNNLAPVLSMSYGFCEALTSPSDAQTLRGWAKQANAQGMTWLAASGDAGGADCVSGSSRAGGGLSVDIPAAIPEVTGMGGTEFNEGAGTYWSASNTANSASVLSYIPEVAWNDTAIDGDPSATGGGASVFFSKPTWQMGAGVPNDGARDVPDVSLASSADHDGYLVYTQGKLVAVGGTSVAAPTFAGITALLNQRVVASGSQSAPGLGNINPALYNLAQARPSVFHDITDGDNLVTVTCTRARNCTSGTYGYHAGPGYDQTTGLGSVDANQLAAAWTTEGTLPRTTASLALTASNNTIAANDTVTLTATVKSPDGGTPVGSVSFYSGTATLGTAVLTPSTAGSATATLSLSGAQLPAGGSPITARYSGDTTYTNATASISITVTAPPAGSPTITAVANGASFRQSFAPGMVLTVFGTQLAASTAQASAVPLPAQLGGVSATVNGMPAPLYYVSPTQVNLQIPYEAGSSGQATVAILNGGLSATATFPLSSAAPGIFSGAAITASRGQSVAIYITGGGAVSPTVASGAAPATSTPLANLPAPVQAVTVTVAGERASVVFTGIPWGLVGVTQINFQVPSDAPLGPQTLVVSVGDVASPAATITIQ